MPLPLLGAAIAPLAAKILPAVLPQVANVVAGPAMNMLQQLAGSVFSQDGKGGVFSDKVNLSLPNPLAKLNGLLGDLGKGISAGGDLFKKVGDFLQGKPRKLENGHHCHKPHFLNPKALKIHMHHCMRLQGLVRTLNINININVNGPGGAGAPGGTSGTGGAGGTTGTGGAGGTSGTGGGTNIGGVKVPDSLFSKGLSGDQQAMLDKIEDPKLKEQTRVQMEMANMNNMMQFISNMVKILGDIDKAIVSNIR